VPPIRPLETLHNALSLRKLDSFLQDMILAQIFKTPTGSPPRHVHDVVPGATKSSLVAAGTTLCSTDTIGVVSSIMVRPDQSAVRRDVQTGGGGSEMMMNSSTTGTCLSDQPVSEDIEESNDEEMNKLLASKKERKFQNRKSVIGWST